MKVRELAKEYAKRMEYDLFAGEVALENTQDLVKEYRQKVEKAKPKEKAGVKERLMMLERQVQDYKGYIETAERSLKIAKRRMKGK